ncbi:hypothetical protein JDW15_03530 [Aerococcaceae bacterium zg-ZJ1578]|uniref:hypothetical protein n=1 Tax=Aerococcaceae bacterium zg-252 TaxID=2796928 RepID=UPI001A2F8E1B|nr:hypothetical protein [Aerococcaceae bacterium zg-1578]
MKKFDPQDQLEFLKLIKLLLITSLIVQIVVVSAYYFGEKQVVLAFPMLLGIFCTAVALFYSYGMRD